MEHVRGMEPNQLKKSIMSHAVTKTMYVCLVNVICLQRIMSPLLTGNE